MTLPFDDLLDHGVLAYCEGCFAVDPRECVCSLTPSLSRDKAELEAARHARMTRAEQRTLREQNEHAARSGGSRARR